MRRPGFNHRIRLRIIVRLPSGLAGTAEEVGFLTGSSKLITDSRSQVAFPVVLDPGLDPLIVIGRVVTTKVTRLKITVSAREAVEVMVHIRPLATEPYVAPSMVGVLEVIVMQAVPNGLRATVGTGPVAGVTFYYLLLILVVELRFQAAPSVVRLHWAVIHGAIPGGMTAGTRAATGVCKMTCPTTSIV